MSCHRFFTELRLQCDYAAQDVLDSLRSAAFISGFRLAAVVGGGGHNPDFISVVVDRLPQRLVRCPGDFVSTDSPPRIGIGPAEWSRGLGVGANVFPQFPR